MVQKDVITWVKIISLRIVCYTEKMSDEANQNPQLKTEFSEGPPITTVEVKRAAVSLLLDTANDEITQGKGSSIYMMQQLLLEKTDSWHSGSIPMQVIYLDLRIEQMLNKMKRVEGQETEEARSARIIPLQEKLDILRLQRKMLNNSLPEELQANDVFSLVNEDFGAQNEENLQPFELFRRSLFFYGDQAKKAIEKMHEYTIDPRLIDFYQQNPEIKIARRKARYWHLSDITREQNWQFPTIDGKQMTKIDRSLFLQAMNNRYSVFDAVLDDDSEIIQRFNSLLSDPENSDQVARLLRLLPEDNHTNLKLQYEHGEIDFIPNKQENLRPLLLADLFYRLHDSGEMNIKSVFESWVSHWGGAEENEQVYKFVNLVLDLGYLNMDPVSDKDRTKLLQQLKNLMEGKTLEYRAQDKVNRQLSEKNAGDIVIDEQALFHQTELSALGDIFKRGILANEILFQTRNALGGSESDLAASFWIVGSEDPEGKATLKDAIHKLCKKGTNTAALLRNRIVVGSMSPTRDFDADLFFYESTGTNRIATTRIEDIPFAQRFVRGMELGKLKQTNDSIYQHTAFALLGLPQDRINFVFIPDHLKEEYAVKAKDLPAYVPAFSSETGLLIYSVEEYDMARKDMM